MCRIDIPRSALPVFLFLIVIIFNWIFNRQMGVVIVCAQITARALIFSHGYGVSERPQLRGNFQENSARTIEAWGTFLLCNFTERRLGTVMRELNCQWDGAIQLYQMGRL